jgi:hypothetical protein
MNNWSSISEININNPIVPGSPSPCPILSIPVDRISSIGSALPSPEKNSIDNDISTKWSNLGLGSWLQFDLGQEKQICDIGISWYKGDIRDIDFIISVSQMEMNLDRYFQALIVILQTLLKFMISQIQLVNILELLLLEIV